VLNGRNVVRLIENLPTDASSRPKKEVVISNSGELHGEEYHKATDKVVDKWGDVFEDFPADETSISNAELSPEAARAEYQKIAIKLKETGNAAFKAGEPVAALQKYLKALRYLEAGEEGDDEPAETGADAEVKATADNADERDFLHFQLFNNAALMANKTKDYTDAVKYASNAIGIKNIPDDQKAKAYFRRALARSARKSYNEAHNDLLEAGKLSPNDAAIRKETADVKRKLEHDKKNEKAALSKFFGA
jgi:peptidyl-prolyl isomerase D